MSRKKQFLPFLILAVSLLGFSACTKKKDSPSGGTGKPFYMKVDGAAFEPAGGGRYYTVGGGPMIQIVGDDPTTTTVELYLTSSAVGTYALGAYSTTTNSASVFYNSGSRQYTSTSGEVKITKSAGDKISGTFHYTAVGTAGTLEVTAGEFNDITKH